MSNYDRNATAWNRPNVGQAATAEVDQGLRAYMLGVYNHMVLGLGVTGLVALGVNMMATTTNAVGRTVLTPLGQALYVSPLKWVVILAPLAFVLYFSFRIDKMSGAAARGVFLAFAAVMGLSLSSLLAIFTGASVARVFFITAGAFGALSLYGYTTRRDLSAMGAFLVMGLFGLIIASIVNLFLQSSGMQWVLSILSVGVFSGLTAWDTQQIKEMYYENDSSELALKKSVNGALMLYLDFINIFQSLLMIFGNRE